jgi:hypothetical protein
VLLIVAVLIALGACSGPAATCELDDGTGTPAAAVLIQRDVGGTMTDVVDGGDLPLIPAPQGGVIVLVGARVQGIGGCELRVNGALRDTVTNRVVGLEERPIVVADRGDGWSVPEEPAALSSYANVAVCPTSTGVAIDGNPLRLEVRITGADGSPIELFAMVTPRCEPDDTFCRCDCNPTCAAPTRP